MIDMMPLALSAQDASPTSKDTHCVLVELCAITKHAWNA